jgi:hypothetical protein
MNDEASPVTDFIIKQLQRESAELRERLDQFGKLLGEFPNLSMLDVIGPQARTHVITITAVSSAEVGPHLRDIALRCQSLARESTDVRAAGALEGAGAELAHQASTLEAIFTVPNVARGP